MSDRKVQEKCSDENKENVPLGNASCGIDAANRPLFGDCELSGGPKLPTKQNIPDRNKPEALKSSGFKNTLLRRRRETKSDPEPVYSWDVIDPVVTDSVDIDRFDIVLVHSHEDLNDWAWLMELVKPAPNGTLKVGDGTGPTNTATDNTKPMRNRWDWSSGLDD